MKQDINSLAELDKALNSTAHAVVVFTQPNTCVPCKRLKPHLDKLADKYADPAILIVDLDAVPDAMIEYELLSVPQVKLFRDGQYSKDLAGRTVVKLEQELNLQE